MAGYNWNNWKYCNVSVLKGVTLAAIEKDDDEIKFKTVEGKEYVMYHEQDCCESVYIESIVGNLKDLIGSEILVAEEVSNVDFGQLDKYDDSYTWTFYKFATIKGHVDIRWYGTSNGYYSESVTFAVSESIH